MIWVSIPLWSIAASLLFLIDWKKRSIRMVDVDRANVYSKHLGKKLKGEGESG